MSIVQAVARMQEIATTIRHLNGETTPAASDAAQSTGTQHTAFASALADAGASGATPSIATTGSATAVDGRLVNNGATGADVVADARKYLGVPYVFGGTSSSGLDCSGLVQKVYGDLGISVPRLVTGQGEVGVQVPSIAQARPGDLIVCNGGEHIAIYAGDGKIIEAPHTGSHVMERDNWISSANTVTIRRIVPQGSEMQQGLLAQLGLSPQAGLAAQLGLSSAGVSMTGASALGSSALGSSALGASALGGSALGGSALGSGTATGMDARLFALMAGRS